MRWFDPVKPAYDPWVTGHWLSQKMYHCGRCQIPLQPRDYWTHIASPEHTGDDLMAKRESEALELRWRQENAPADKPKKRRAAKPKKTARHHPYQRATSPSARPANAKSNVATQSSARLMTKTDLNIPSASNRESTVDSVDEFFLHATSTKKRRARDKDEDVIERFMIHSATPTKGKRKGKARRYVSPDTNDTHDQVYPL